MRGAASIHMNGRAQGREVRGAEAAVFQRGENLTEQFEVVCRRFYRRRGHENAIAKPHGKR